MSEEPVVWELLNMGTGVTIYFRKNRFNRSFK